MTKNLPIRLAMRREGNQWNAYVAKSDTMEGAVWVGSIAICFVEHNAKRKDAFLAIMTEALSDVIEETFGHKPMWNEIVDAPEDERTKE